MVSRHRIACLDVKPIVFTSRGMPKCKHFPRRTQARPAVTRNESMSDNVALCRQSLSSPHLSRTVTTNLPSVTAVSTKAPREADTAFFTSSIRT